MVDIPWIPFGIIGVLSWSIWALRRFGSHWGYREIVNEVRSSPSTAA